MMKCILIFNVFLIWTFSVQAIDYKVVRVVDGDTFVATDGVIDFKVRLVGVDAPESQQKYGKIAKQFLKSQIEGKNVTLAPLKKSLDRYNRILANVYFQNNDIGIVLIESGLAYYYRPTCQDYPVDKKKYNFDPQLYIVAEAKAKKHKLGLWGESDNTLPCLYRKLHPF